jgi:putrescine transport system substrate-binding protein
MKKIMKKGFVRPYIVAFLWLWPLWAEEPILNVYNWFDVIHQDIIAQFEKETGIQVNYDVYDSNEVLEAKLLTGHTGYDIVGPSAFPFLARQVPAGIYQPLKPERIPNLNGLDPVIMARLARADPGNRYAIPLLWGVVGFAYNIKKIQERFPQAPLDSWAMLFNPEVIRHFADCKVTMLEESGETLVPLFIYLGMNPLTNQYEDLQKASRWLQAIRPYIARFDALRSSEDIYSGQICLAVHWVGAFEHTKAMQPAGEARDNIRIVIPKEGTALWIDTLAIPLNAPHPENAHKFINFILRPDIAARITNYTHYANAVVAAKPFLKEEIRNNPNIYPPVQDFHKFFMNEVSSPRYYRLMNRIMLKFRTNRW